MYFLPLFCFVLIPEHGKDVAWLTLLYVRDATYPDYLLPLIPVRDGPATYVGSPSNQIASRLAYHSISCSMLCLDQWLPHTVIMGMSVDAIGYFLPYDVLNPKTYDDSVTKGP